jgi:hypothetical protein
VAKKPSSKPKARKLPSRGASRIPPATPAEKDRADFRDYLGNLNLQAFFAKYQDGDLTSYEGLASYWAVRETYPEEHVTENLRVAAALFLRLTAIAHERDQCARLVEEAGQDELAAEIRGRPSALDAIDRRFH